MKYLKRHVTGTMLDGALLYVIWTYHMTGDEHVQSLMWFVLWILMVLTWIMVFGVSSLDPKEIKKPLRFSVFRDAIICLSLAYVGHWVFSMFLMLGVFLLYGMASNIFEEANK